MAIDGLSVKPWVLLPGTLCTTGVFRDFLDILGVEPDLCREVPMRHGAVGDYAEDLDRAMTPGAVLCGFSLGAIVAAHHAHRLDASLVLLFALNPNADDSSRAEGRRALERDVGAKGGGAALGERLAPFAGPNPGTARALVLAMADCSAGYIGAQTELALSRPSALDALARTHRPVLFVTGTEDGLTPPALAEAAAAVTPDGRVAVVPGLGHYALAEDPGACSKVVARECLKWT
jgi:pimeloyl-ACP methyl ester carboxylesterase